MTQAVVTGHFGKGSLESFLLDGFRSAGASADPLAYTSMGGGRIIRRGLGFLLESKERRGDRRTVQGYGGQPEFVLCMKPALWGRDMVRYLRSSLPGAVLAAYLPDDPVAAWRGGHFRRRAVSALPEWDVVITWTRQQVNSLEVLGARRVAVVPFGWAPEHRAPRDLLSTFPTFDVAFVGAWDRARVKIVSGLAAELALARFVVAGPGWRRGDLPQNVQICSGPVHGDQLVRLTLSAALSLNIARPQNAGNHNMRSFELAATGAVQVVVGPMFAETSSGDGPPVHQIDDLAALVERSKSMAWLHGERERAWASAASGCTYTDRARELLDILA